MNFEKHIDEGTIGLLILIASPFLVMLYILVTPFRLVFKLADKANLL